jgi:hypothetical protein
MADDPETVERVRRLLASRDDVVEKRMVGGLSWSVRDRMCCGVTVTGLMVRLGRDGVAAALSEPHVRPMTLGGKPLAAFVLVEPAGYAADADLVRWLDRALEFLASEG